jgi:hypothetical protein
MDIDAFFIDKFRDFEGARRDRPKDLVPSSVLPSVFDIDPALDEEFGHGEIFLQESKGEQTVLILVPGPDKLGILLEKHFDLFEIAIIDRGQEVLGGERKDE